METKSLGALEQQLPEIGFGTWNYAGGTEPIRAGVEQSYGTEDIVVEAIPATAFAAICGPAGEVERVLRSATTQGIATKKLKTADSLPSRFRRKTGK